MHWFSWAAGISLSGAERDALGYTASALVLLTFCMSSMRRLRVAAIASNVAFISYALAAHLLPVLLLHGILLPVNLYRLAQIRRWRGALAGWLPSGGGADEA